MEIRAAKIARSRLLAALAALVAAPKRAWAAPALAAGDAAPEFTAPATLAGRPFTFDLRRAVARDGMVLLYFFPKAFTLA